MFDPALTERVQVPVYHRNALAVGSRIAGPALVTEAQTTTVVTSPFDATVDAQGYLVLTRRVHEH